MLVMCSGNQVLGQVLLELLPPRSSFALPLLLRAYDLEAVEHNGLELRLLSRRTFPLVQGLAETYLRQPALALVVPLFSQGFQFFYLAVDGAGIDGKFAEKSALRALVVFPGV